MGYARSLGGYTDPVLGGGRRNARASSEPGRSGAEIVRVDAGNDSKYGARTAEPFKRSSK